MQEITSLCSQLAYVYSSNRKAAQPFSSLLFTSLNGRTHTRLESQSNAGYKRWTGTKWWSEGYQELWASGSENTEIDVCSKESIVYLTADAKEELSELKPGETYIIGGICDHNRYKVSIYGGSCHEHMILANIPDPQNLCENKAKADSIRSAKLPIGSFVAQMPTRKILTVNQVFDILLQWVEHRDWEKAFHTVIPKRKFQDSGKHQQEGSQEAQNPPTPQDEACPHEV